jgi:hypothetical protein
VVLTSFQVHKIDIHPVSAKRHQVTLVMKPEVRHFLVHDSLQFGHESTRIQIVYPQFPPAQYDAPELVDRYQIGRVRYSLQDPYSGAPVEGPVKFPVSPGWVLTVSRPRRRSPLCSWRR